MGEALAPAIANAVASKPKPASACITIPAPLKTICGSMLIDDWSIDWQNSDT